MFGFNYLSREAINGPAALRLLTRILQTI